MESDCEFHNIQAARLCWNKFKMFRWGLGRPWKTRVGAITMRKLWFKSRDFAGMALELHHSMVPRQLTDQVVNHQLLDLVDHKLCQALGIQ